MKKISVMAATLGLLLSTTGCKTEVEKETPFIKAPIASAADLGRRIEKLSSDELEGRAPSTPGGVAASQYIADEMKAAGMVPMGVNGTYFQPVTLTESQLLPSSSFEVRNGDQTIMQSDPSNSVYWTKRSVPSLTVENSEVVFVGYGVVAPEFGWNDYEGLDVKGKTVVMLVNDPGFATQDPEIFKGNTMTYYGRWTYKYEEAGRQGAAAAIVIHETKPASYPWAVVEGGWTGPQLDLERPDGGANRAMLEGWFHYDAAKSVFEAAGQDIEALKKAALTKDFTPVSLDGISVNARIDQTFKKTKSRNVAGGVKGTKYPDEYVLYMAHWDHMGKNPDMEGDNIFNGAVDNATGTAAILEIGQAFVEQGAPERSAIFVAVTAEESGLLGSAYYGADPLVPLKDTVGGINIDAILPVGKTKDMVVIGYGSSELEDRLKDVIEPRGMYIVPDQKPEAGYFYRSDHISLAKLGVPMLYADGGVDHETLGKEYGMKFGDDYTAERYHKVADEYDNSWDLSGIQQTTEILFELGYDLANSRDWPNWYETAEFRTLRDEMRKD